MRAVQGVGTVTEVMITKVMNMTPEAFEIWAAKHFEMLYDLSERADDIRLIREGSPSANKAVAIFSGAASGALGLAALLPDLALTTTNIFNMIRKVARQHGFDTSQPDVRMACIGVFVSGGPSRADDGVDTSLIASRFAMNGVALSDVLSRASKQYAARLMTGLGPKAVPLLGAIGGGAVNAAFINHYQTVAEITFRLNRLQLDHPQTDVAALYRKLRADPRRTLK